MVFFFSINLSTRRVILFKNHVACFCGNDPYRYGPDDVASTYIMNYDCDQECAGDSMQTCGGGLKLSIYSTGIAI